MPRVAIPRQQYCRSLPLSLVERLRSAALHAGVSETVLATMAIRRYADAPTVPASEIPTDKAQPWNRRVPVQDIETMKARAQVWGMGDREALIAVLSAFLSSSVI